MKLSLAFSALALPFALAEDQASGRIRGCYFVKYFGSGDDLSTSGVNDFTAVAGAEVSCHTACKSGSETTVAYNLGGAVGAVGNTDGETDSDCTMTTKFTTTEDITQLGWSVDVPLDYKKMVLACYCSDDGSQFTIDNIEATIDAAETAINDYIQEAQDYLDNNGIDGCFSESAVVQVEHKGQVAMKDLQLGDKVLTEKNTYQPVYSFGHRKPDTEIEFYQIYAEGMTAPLEMTGNHMIMAKDGRHTQAIRADRLKIGDKLLHVQGQKEVFVTNIKTVEKAGLYMPLTPNGKIVVNNVLASNYISISDEAPGVVAHSNWFFTFLSMPEQRLSHWWLSPFRMLCMGVSSSYCSNGDEMLTAHSKNVEDQGILPWLLTGRRLAEVAELQHNLIQMVVFGFPGFIVFGAFNLVETILLGPSIAPGLMVFLVACVVYAKKMKKEIENRGEEEKTDLNEKLMDA